MVRKGSSVRVRCWAWLCRAAGTCPNRATSRAPRPVRRPCPTQSTAGSRRGAPRTKHPATRSSTRSRASGPRRVRIVDSGLSLQWATRDPYAGSLPCFVSATCGGDAWSGRSSIGPDASIREAPIETTATAAQSNTVDLFAAPESGAARAAAGAGEARLVVATRRGAQRFF